MNKQLGQMKMQIDTAFKRNEKRLQEEVRLLWRSVSRCSAVCSREVDSHLHVIAHGSGDGAGH